MKKCNIYKKAIVLSLVGLFVGSFGRAMEENATSKRYKISFTKAKGASAPIRYKLSFKKTKGASAPAITPRTKTFEQFVGDIEKYYKTNNMSGLTPYSKQGFKEPKKCLKKYRKMKDMKLSEIVVCLAYAIDSEDDQLYLKLLSRIKDKNEEKKMYKFTKFDSSTYYFNQIDNIKTLCTRLIQNKKFYLILETFRIIQQVLKEKAPYFFLLGYEDYLFHFIVFMQNALLGHSINIQKDIESRLDQCISTILGSEAFMNFKNDDSMQRSVGAASSTESFDRRSLSEGEAEREDSENDEVNILGAALQSLRLRAIENQDCLGDYIAALENIYTDLVKYDQVLKPLKELLADTGRSQVSKFKILFRTESNHSKSIVQKLFVMLFNSPDLNVFSKILAFIKNAYTIRGKVKKDNLETYKDIESRYTDPRKLFVNNTGSDGLLTRFARLFDQDHALKFKMQCSTLKKIFGESNIPKLFSQNYYDAQGAIIDKLIEQKCIKMKNGKIILLKEKDHVKQILTFFGVMKNSRKR